MVMNHHRLGWREELIMHHWLRNQLMKAFLTRDSRQIRLLNDCWYFYRTHNFQVNSEVDSN